MTADRYHHGDLPNALRCAAVDVIDERGLGGFSLREVARRAGVSHTAPAHHFGDVRGLLTSVAVEGFTHLRAELLVAVERVDAVAADAGAPPDPVDRLVALGVAYVGTARAHPAHLEVMFRRDVVDAVAPELVEAGMGAYGVLEEVVRSIVEGEGLDVELDTAVLMCWSMMQGLVALESKLETMREVAGSGIVAAGDASAGPAPVTVPDVADDVVLTDLVRRFTGYAVAGWRATV